jgi:hypothetical protein
MTGVPVSPHVGDMSGGGGGGGVDVLVEPAELDVVGALVGVLVGAV